MFDIILDKNMNFFFKNDSQPTGLNLRTYK